MEFVLHGVKFNYENGKIYRFYELKKGDEWKEIKIQSAGNGYKRFKFYVNKKLLKICVLLHIKKISGIELMRKVTIGLKKVKNGEQRLD